LSWHEWQVVDALRQADAPLSKKAIRARTRFQQDRVESVFNELKRQGLVAVLGRGKITLSQAALAALSVHDFPRPPKPVRGPSPHKVIRRLLAAHGPQTVEAIAIHSGTMATTVVTRLREMRNAGVVERFVPSLHRLVSVTPPEPDAPPQTRAEPKSYLKDHPIAEAILHDLAHGMRTVDDLVPRLGHPRDVTAEAVRWLRRLRYIQELGPGFFVLTDRARNFGFGRGSSWPATTPASNRSSVRKTRR
jgi:DNA-binding IclR family transcriptional regulator